MPAEHVGHLVNLLTYVAQRNGPSHPQQLTSFHMETKEGLLELVGRLDEHIRCSTSCYAVALVYMDRITEGNADLPLNLETVNLLFTTSLLLANQFLDDKAERALQFARVARVHPSVMARLKIDFLFRVSFSLTVTSEEMRGYSDKLHGRYSTKYFRDTEMWDGIAPLVPTSHHRIMAAAPAPYIAPSPMAMVPRPQQSVSRRPVTSHPQMPIQPKSLPTPMDVDPIKPAAAAMFQGPVPVPSSDMVWRAARGIETLNPVYL